MNFARLLALASLYACLTAAADKPTAAMFLLFDLSDSTQDPSIRQRYWTDCQKVLDSLTGGEVVIGDVITANSLATASYPVHARTPAYHAGANKLVYKLELKKSLQAVREQARKAILESPVAPLTDLMNSLQLADKALNGDEARDAPRKVLVVFSDMVEESRAYNFTRDPLTPGRIRQIIDKERLAGHLPRLDNVQVWVAGAGAAAPGKAGLPPDRLYRIQEFWLQYFQAAHASLAKEHYAASLLNFSAMH